LPVELLLGRVLLADLGNRVAAVGGALEEPCLDELFAEYSGLFGTESEDGADCLLGEEPVELVVARVREGGDPVTDCVRSYRTELRMTGDGDIELGEAHELDRPFESELADAQAARTGVRGLVVDVMPFARARDTALARASERSAAPAAEARALEGEETTIALRRGNGDEGVHDEGPFGSLVKVQAMHSG
jgi:hypothetical protein